MMISIFKRSKEILIGVNNRFSEKLKKPLFTTFLLLLIFSFSLAACGSGSSVPKAGKWEATTDKRDSFVFNVSEDGQAINIINFTLSDFSCGGWATSGLVSSSNQDPSSITDNQFSINTSGAQMDFKITGEFDASGTNASGSLKAESGGTVCNSVEWEAKPQE